MPTHFETFAAAVGAERGGLFTAGRPIVSARAPTWTDLIGGGALYGGSLALGWPLGVSSFAAVQLASEPAIRVVDGSGEAAMSLADLVDEAGWPREYADAAERLAGLPLAARLVAGACLTLMREEFVRLDGGARLLLQPAGGPTSPLSVVVATAQALVTACGVHLAPRELALACRTALAWVSGRPQEPLGPLTATLAPAGELLLCHAQPAWHWGNLPLPPDTTIWTLRVGDGPAPATLASAAAMAYHMAADAAGLQQRAADERWRGYLANIGTATFERRHRRLLPARISGAEFLQRYDWPTAGPPIDPAAAYPLRAVAALAVEEHLRTRSAVALLRAAASKAQRDDDLLLVGELMAQSHWAQRACGLGDAHADDLLDMVLGAGPANGLYGARCPSPASGATLVVLGRPEGEEALRAIAEGYAIECGLPIALLGGSAPGCTPAGAREI